jgi:hypothetical protein
MKLVAECPIPSLPTPISITDKIMLIGSCFTENISKLLQQCGFSTFINPHGILFNPVSVAACMRDVIECRHYQPHQLFYLNEAYHSWLHHSEYSGISAPQACDKINASINAAHHFMQQCQYLVITLGSAFAYRHNELDMHVSNNHRAPAQWFTKELLPIQFIMAQLQMQIDALKKINPTINIIFTISPVRHLRDGLIDNNRSKARLIDAVHELVFTNNNTHYFPSYEIVMDELRDYRYYDIDLAHPNYAATQYVWQKFATYYINPANAALMQQVQQLHTAMNHKPFNPNSQAHQLFVKQQLDTAEQLLATHQYLPIQHIINYFKQALI